MLGLFEYKSMLCKFLYIYHTTDQCLFLWIIYLVTYIRKHETHVFFILVFNQLDALIFFFYIKFHFTPLHVSSVCARNM